MRPTAPTTTTTATTLFKKQGKNATKKRHQNSQVIYLMITRNHQLSRLFMQIIPRSLPNVRASPASHYRRCRASLPLDDLHVHRNKRTANRRVRPVRRLDENKIIYETYRMGGLESHHLLFSRRKARNNSGWDVKLEGLVGIQSVRKTLYTRWQWEQLAGLPRKYQIDFISGEGSLEK